MLLPTQSETEEDTHRQQCRADINPIRGSVREWAWAALTFDCEEQEGWRQRED